MHALDLSNGRVNMAFVGRREEIWHGLGQNLKVGAPIEEWKEAAGMDWIVESTPVMFNCGGDEPCLFPSKNVFYRSDTKEPLSIMSDAFKIVQPGEVLEFFRDLTESHGMTLSTAGCLFNGARFWALAELGKTAEILGGDPIDGHLLFVTSVDGSFATTVKVVSTRVVCNNTMNVAMREGGQVIRKTHRSTFNAEEVKLDLGLVDSSWDVFCTKLNKLANHEMSDREVADFFRDTSFDPKKDMEDQPTANWNKFFALNALYAEGAGADNGHGTAYGVLNAVTNYYTHGTGRKVKQDRKFLNGYIENDKMKATAMEDLLELC